MIGKAGLLRIAAVVDVSQVNEHLAAEDRREPVEIECSEFVPFGYDDHRIGPFGRGIGVVGELDAVKDLLGLVTGDRIEGADLGAALDQALDQRDRSMHRSCRLQPARRPGLADWHRRPGSAR